MKYDFLDDNEKINDLFILSKSEFLKSYSYVSEDEYDNTVARIKTFINFRNKDNLRQRVIRNADKEKARQGYLDYYYNNKEKINTRRNTLGSIQRLANVDGIKNKQERKIIMDYVGLHEQEIRDYKKKIQEEKEKVARKIYYRNHKNKKKEEK